LRARGLLGGGLSGGVRRLRPRAVCARGLRGGVNDRRRLLSVRRALRGLRAGRLRFDTSGGRALPLLRAVAFERRVVVFAEDEVEIARAERDEEDGGDGLERQVEVAPRPDEREPHGRQEDGRGHQHRPRAIPCGRLRDFLCHTSRSLEW
jgi:hypothetical protein